MWNEICCKKCGVVLDHLVFTDKNEYGESQYSDASVGAYGPKTMIGKPG